MSAGPIAAATFQQLKLPLVINNEMSLYRWPITAKISVFQLHDFFSLGMDGVEVVCRMLSCQEATRALPRFWESSSWLIAASARVMKIQVIQEVLDSSMCK